VQVPDLLQPRGRGAIGGRRRLAGARRLLCARHAAHHAEGSAQARLGGGRRGRGRRRPSEAERRGRGL